MYSAFYRLQIYVLVIYKIIIMPPRKKNKYSNDDLLKAVADIKTNKISTRAASQKYCIPQSTIADRISGRFSPMILKSGE